MHVIVIGLGTIGASIAQFLAESGHNVVAVDIDKERLERLEVHVDAQTIQGHACDPEVLRTANVEQADLVLALTSNEELNVVAAAAVKHMGSKKSVARVHSPHYLKTSRLDYRSTFNIDLTLSPELLTAAEVVKHLNNPDALAMEFYAHGKVQLVQVELDEENPYCARPLKDLDLPAGVLVVLVSRWGKVLIPRGDAMLLPGDKVTLLGKSSTLTGIRHLTEKSFSGRGSVMIAGGGETGAILASALETKVSTVKLFEIDAQRCRALSERLDKTLVLHGDATERNFLEEERIARADVFVAAMRSDEDNIMASLLARKLGAGKCVTIVKRPDYIPLLEETTTVDLALSPRQIAAGKVLALIKRGAIKNVALLENGQAEVIEFIPRPDSPLLDTPLKDIEFPEGCLVGMIARGNTIKIPSGRDRIRQGDTVIMVVLAEVADSVESMF